MSSESSLADLSLPSLPRHVAIIMDGNNRYGKREALPEGEGHRAGKDQLDPIVEQARRLGIQVLTVFAFSSENWQRPAKEVALLMKLFAQTIREQIPRMKKHDIALRFIGNRTQLSTELQQLMQEAESITAHHTAMTLVIAVSYGGMWDVAQAARQVALQVERGLLKVDQISEQTLQQHISLSDLPAVDLLIRTGGDYRLSNFLLWQAAYAELYFTETLWPDFSVEEFNQALEVFAQRERRFGRTSEQVKQQPSNNTEN
ncbi:polyprenyl diphosphate synthase [Alkanindiges sp. WGS2144]|uniref:polyprenyl diphosphate synthase n=1 Tax=Alkanindiges sp. WGS2144 TaxID=3366808 RepID=UPI003753B02F